MMESVEDRTLRQNVVMAAVARGLRAVARGVSSAGVARWSIEFQAGDQLGMIEKRDEEYAAFVWLPRAPGGFAPVGRWTAVQGGARAAVGALCEEVAC